jgi:hypothetical protein
MNNSRQLTINVSTFKLVNPTVYLFIDGGDILPFDLTQVDINLLHDVSP